MSDITTWRTELAGRIYDHAIEQSESLAVGHGVRYYYDPENNLVLYLIKDTNDADMNANLVFRLDELQHIRLISKQADAVAHIAEEVRLALGSFREPSDSQPPIELWLT